MNAIEILKQQHREIEFLFKQLAAARLPDHKEDLFSDLADAIAVHCALEEQHFYPMVGARGAPDLSSNWLLHHRGIKRALAVLMETSSEDRTFAAKVAVLKSEVERHIMEEEQEILPQVRALFDRPSLDNLARQMCATEAEMQDDGAARLTIPPLPAGAQIATVQ